MPRTEVDRSVASGTRWGPPFRPALLWDGAALVLATPHSSPTAPRKHAPARPPVTWVGAASRLVDYVCASARVRGRISAAPARKNA